MWFHITHARTHARAHLTALCLGLPGWAGTRNIKPIWILLKQETVSGSGIRWAICKSAPCSKEITMPAPHHSVFYRPDALPAAQPTVSKHWRQCSGFTSTNKNLIQQKHRQCSYLCLIFRNFSIWVYVKFQSGLHLWHWNTVQTFSYQNTDNAVVHETHTHQVCFNTYLCLELATLIPKSNLNSTNCKYNLKMCNLQTDNTAN